MDNVLDSDEMLKFLPESGQILGTLRNNLISALGTDRAKGFMLRYGWDCGNNFSNHLRNKNDYGSLTLEYLFRVGSQMHGSTADLGISVTKLQMNTKTKDYYSEGYWQYSQEAEKHIENFGLSDEPVCFTLIGYAGGYVSNHLGRKVIFKEVECKGKGDSRCQWIAKPVEDWGEEIQKELFYYEEENLGQELDKAFIQIEEQKEVFRKVIKINGELTDTFLTGSGLPGIVNFLSNEMNYAVMLENYQLELIESSHTVKLQYLESNDYVKKEITKSIKSFFENKKTIRLEVQLSEKSSFYRLISPIFVRNKVFGYISFISESDSFSELDYLVLEKAASICAMQILNETSAFENEQRVKEELLNGIFGDEASVEDIVYRLKLIGYTINQPQYVFLFNLEEHNENKYQSMDENFIDFKKSAVEKINRAIEQRGANCLITTRVNQVIVLIPEAFIDQFSSELACGKWLLEDVFSESKFIDAKLGISNVCNQVGLIRKGLGEAEKTINVMMISESKLNVNSYKELGAIAKLICPENFLELKSFSDDVLVELKKYDKRNQSDLLETLIWYMGNNGHMKNTAKDMNISLGSVRYRLKRIQELSQLDLSTSQGFFDAHVAIQLYQLLSLDPILVPR